MQVEYEIKPGDTLSDVIYKLTGNKSSDVYNEIAKNNNITDPNKIQVGQKITFNKADYATKEYKDSHPDEFPHSSSNTGGSSSTSGSTGTGSIGSNSGNVNVTPVSGYVGNYSPNVEYEICKPSAISGWTPQKGYATFNIKENAGSKFEAINNSIKACCNEIDNIISNLKTLRTKMGQNDGTNTQIDRIVSQLEQKKQDLITKNSELLQACNQVIEYVYQNKQEKTEEARTVAQTISQIDVYRG